MQYNFKAKSIFNYQVYHLIHKSPTLTLTQDTLHFPKKLNNPFLDFLKLFKEKKKKKKIQQLREVDLRARFTCQRVMTNGKKLS